MKYTDIVSCVAAVLAGWVVAGLLFDHQRPGYLLEITEDNLHQTLEENKFVVVFYRALWTRPSPELEAAAQHFADPNLSGRSDIKFAKLTCPAPGEGLCENLGIVDSPMVLLYRRDKLDEPVECPFRMESGRLVAWLNKKTSPLLLFSLHTEEEVQRFVASYAEEQQQKQKKSRLVVGYFDDDSNDNNKRERFLEMADSFVDFVFGEAVGVEGRGNGEALLYREFDAPLNLTVDELAQSLPVHGYPYIVEISEGYERLLERGVNIGVLVVDESAEGQVERILKAFTPMASRLSDKVGFVYVPSQFHELFRHEIGVSNTIPTFILEDTHHLADASYPLPKDQELTPMAVEQHIAAALEGRLTRFLHSESIPENDNLLPCADQMRSLAFMLSVTDPTKDVLVLFYSPWCPNRKTPFLLRAWDELRESLQDNEIVIIAKWGKINNAVVEIKNMPSIYLFPATDSIGVTPRFIEYEGGVRLEDLKAWLHVHAISLTRQRLEHKDKL